MPMSGVGGIVATMTNTKTITALTQTVNLTVTEAGHLARGGKPTTDNQHLSVAGLRHGYSGDIIPGASMPAAYDLGLRLRAKDEKTVVDRATYPSRFKWLAEPVAIKRACKTTWHTNAGIKTTQETHDWLYSLVNHPVIPPALHVEKPNTLTVLAEDMKSLGAAMQPRVLALLLFWQDAMAHAGVGAALPVLTDLGYRYATSRPDYEDDIDHWAASLGLNERGYDALLALGVMLDDNSREVSTLAESWSSRWGSLRKRADEGTLRDRLSPASMASALSSMQSSQEWHLSWTHTGDDLVASAARWTGHVVRSTRWIESTPSSWSFAIGEGVCRYRQGSSVTLVIHRDEDTEANTEATLSRLEKTVNVEVSELGYSHEHGTLITVTCDGKPNNAKALDRAVEDGVCVTLRMQAPNHSACARSGMDASSRRARSDARSWLADTARVPSRRDVPWHVMIAAAV